MSELLRKLAGKPKTKLAPEDIPHLVPMGTNILLAYPKVEEKTKGGVYLPSQAQDTQNLGSSVARIVAVGEHAFELTGLSTSYKPKVGDYVVTMAYAGSSHDLQTDEVYRIVDSSSILAVIKDASQCQ